MAEDFLARQGQSKAEDKQHQYIVQSGAGFFEQFENRQPKMVSDPMRATRMSKQAAKGVIVNLSKLGFDGHLVPVVYGRLRNPVVLKEQ